jgi:hypothetical protein
MDHATLLRTVRLFQGLEPDDHAVLAGSLRECRFKA